DSGRFAVSFDDSVYANKSDQIEKVSRDQTSKRKYSRAQQFLSVLWRETSDCDSDSIASCSSESKTAKISKKNLRTTPSSVHKPELLSAGSDRDSLSSSDSPFRTENVSRLSAIFDKAKNKGHQLVHSHKNKKFTGDTDSPREVRQMITEQDALSIEAEMRMQSKDYATAESSPINKDSLIHSSSLFNWFHVSKAASGGSDKVMDYEKLWIFQVLIKRWVIALLLYNPDVLFHQQAFIWNEILPFLRRRFLSSLLPLLNVTGNYRNCKKGFISGFLWGLYVSFMCFLYFFVSGPVNKNIHVRSDVVLSVSEEFKEQETQRNKVYKGWMNELRSKYDSSTYHVNNAQTVLVRLDGNLLRISRPVRTVLKHAFHTDPTLTEAEPAISSQSIYNLTGATVTLRPKRLARRRWWSRKYPIHIRLAARNSEISTFPLLRRSLSTNEAVEFGKFTSSSDEECDTNKRELKSRLENSDVSSCFDEYGSDRSKDLSRGRSLYFFARSAREKERWFHRLREVCSRCSTRTAAAEITLRRNDVKEVSLDRRFSLPVSSTDSNSLKLNMEYFLYVSNRLQFNKCIDEILKIPHEGDENRTDGNVIYMDLGRNKWNPGRADTSSQLVMSVNALAARIFYDFCRDAYWCKQVQDKIQSKLATLHLPYFIETLELSNLDLGTTPPEIIAVHSPVLDDWGFWIDFELKYRGGIHLTLETKVNLMKLKEGMHKDAVCKKINKVKMPMRCAHHYSDSDLPESPENSPDEDFGSKMEKIQVTKESTSNKLLSAVDKIASSNIFQDVSEFPPVKKMMEGISSTRLLLNVDVIRLEGTMTINIPPPPSDRLWYAFRTPPELSIRSVPQVGDRLVDMSTVSSWIENKLRLLLEKNLVCPNMDDLIVPKLLDQVVFCELLKLRGISGCDSKA
uniref:SMP-LTD domain-containing protein n=1 Tax=Elaeophora elaphi TaxID=1147741 RepID=A0A158Q6T7_9BILA